MAYTTIDNPELYFQTKLYTGNGSTQSITLDGDTDMQPDMLWGKNRSSVTNHELTDVVRGINQRLKPNDTDADQTNTNTFTSFDSDGFSLGTDADVNASGVNHVVWSWKAGTAFTNDASATGIGSIDSAGSFNNDSGFSIVSYTGTGSAGTIKHGLSSTPSCIIIKRRSVADGWIVYHAANTAAPATDYLRLDTTAATADDATKFNDTAPTSSVFSVGSDTSVSGSGSTFIAYCFAEKQGYSKFGSYTGNGSTDGTFVYLGFKPAFVMVKESSGVGNWLMKDNKRPTYNQNNQYLYANGSDSEFTNSVVGMDLLSNGFKCRGTAGDMNGSGNTIIYMAFAENPFVTSSGIPTTGR